MKGQEKIQLNTGDEIGFVRLANEIDEKDTIFFCKVFEVTTDNGERAYRYQYPDGEVARRVVRQSELASHVVRIRVRRNAEMINLSDRLREFVDALERADVNNLEVFHDFGFDSYTVVNRTNETEYKVCLKTIQGEVFASCECSDFRYRSRVCKHVAEVLRDVFKGILQPIERAGKHEIHNQPRRNLMTGLSVFSGQQKVSLSLNNRN